jgi:large subunit ribosomal protein L3
MKKVILGKKIGMTQIILESGEVVPVTIVDAGPCHVLDLMTEEKNGYKAVLLAYESVKEKKLNKSIKGLYKKHGVDCKRFLKEYRVENFDGYEVKKEITVDIFDENDEVSVRSRSIGKGFAGTIVEHNFSRGPMTHGSKNHRRPGSIGAGTDPGRVYKGQKMARRRGNKMVFVKGLKVMVVDKENNKLFIKGAIPGKSGNLVEVIG